MIEQALADAFVRYGLDDFRIVASEHGPRVSTMTVAVPEGTRLAEIGRVQKDLGLALGVPDVTIMRAPESNRILVRVAHHANDRSSDILSGLRAIQARGDLTEKLPCLIGESTDGMPLVLDLARAIHLLVVGSTGSGKSTLLHSLLLSLLHSKNATELELVLIDPKRVEFSPTYDNVPSVLWNGFTSGKVVEQFLGDCVRVMDSRYQQMVKLGARNIYSLMNKDDVSSGTLFRPMVIVVDEFMDLLLDEPGIVKHLVRIAQKGRGAAMHLILGSQRSTVGDGMVGALKANLPTCIAMSMQSAAESRALIGSDAATRLLGAGDMLLKMPWAEPQPVQGYRVDDWHLEGVMQCFTGLDTGH